MSGGDAVYQWSREETGLTSRYDQLVGTLELPQKTFYENILTPKDGGRITLASLTKKPLVGFENPARPMFHFLKLFVI